jgi:hypothetical protein
VNAAQFCKTFYGCNLRIFGTCQSFVPVKPFQPSLMFLSEAGTYSSEAPEKRSTRG